MPDGRYQPCTCQTYRIELISGKARTHSHSNTGWHSLGMGNHRGWKDFTSKPHTPWVVHTATAKIGQAEWLTLLSKSWSIHGPAKCINIGKVTLRWPLNAAQCKGLCFFLTLAKTPIEAGYLIQSQLLGCRLWCFHHTCTPEKLSRTIHDGSTLLLNIKFFAPAPRLHCAWWEALLGPVKLW